MHGLREFCINNKQDLQIFTNVTMHHSVTNCMRETLMKFALNYLLNYISMINILHYLNFESMMLLSSCRLHGNDVHSVSYHYRLLFFCMCLSSINNDLSLYMPSTLILYFDTIVLINLAQIITIIIDLKIKIRMYLHITKLALHLFPCLPSLPYPCMLARIPPSPPPPFSVFTHDVACLILPFDLHNCMKHVSPCVKLNLDVTPLGCQIGLDVLAATTFADPIGRLIIMKTSASLCANPI